jgi:hypothetical protein
MDRSTHRNRSRFTAIVRGRELRCCSPNGPEHAISQYQPPGAPTPPGPGWWLASDGRWYPPAGPAPAPVAPPQPPVPQRSSGKGCLIAAGVVAGVLLLGGIAALAIVLLGARKVADELDDIGRTQVEEARDVEVVACETDDDGFMTATLEITNQSTKTSNYIIDVSFDLVGGDEQLTTAPALVNGLAPGQSTEVVATGFESPPGDFECRVSFVERLSAEG